MAGRSPDIPEQSDPTEEPSASESARTGVPSDAGKAATDTDAASEAAAEDDTAPAGREGGTADVEPAAEVRPTSVLKPETDPEPEPEPESKAEPEPAAEPDSGSDTDTDTDVEHDDEPDPATAERHASEDSGTGPEPEPEPEPESAPTAAEGAAPGAAAGRSPHESPGKQELPPEAERRTPPRALPLPPPAQDTGQAAQSPIALLARLTGAPVPARYLGRALSRRATMIWSPVVAALVLLAVQAFRPLPVPRLVLSGVARSFTLGGGHFAVPWPAKGQAAVSLVGSGTIGTFGAQTPVPTASVAKIMTAYVILHDHPLGKGRPGPRIAVDTQAVRDGRSADESRVQGLTTGETFSEQDMLKMLMIPSGNNIARLLARWDTGSQSESAFVQKMNATAGSLGMRNTTYTDPSGLERSTVSTAVDQLQLATQAMKIDAFRAIVALPDADIPGVGRIDNNNGPLLTAGLGVAGIKTGSNTPAGGTLSWADHKTVDGKDRLILGTMLGQHATGPDPDGANSLVLVQDNCKRIIEAVRGALTSATVVKKGQVVGHVDDGLGDRTPLVATRDLTAVGVPGQQLDVRFLPGGATVPRQAKAGTVFGELTVGGPSGAQRVPVALKTDLAPPSYGTRLMRF